jgi:hypothetical protein
MQRLERIGKRLFKRAARAFSSMKLLLQVIVLIDFAGPGKASQGPEGCPFERLGDK